LNYWITELLIDMINLTNHQVIELA